jgi:DinB family protein
LLAKHCGECHQAALRLVSDLSEDQFRWRPEVGPLSIGWNLWHIGRWDDFLADVFLTRAPALARMGPAAQVWKSRDLASKWGLTSSDLGFEDAGTGLSDADATAIRLPDKEEVVAYVTEAFEHLDRVAAVVDDSLLPQIVPAPLLFPSQAHQDSYGDNLMIWITHSYEHLGMMEAVRGMLGLRGSVTD